VKRLVREALKSTEGRILVSPEAVASYLKSARRLLLEIARTIQVPETVVQRIIVDFRVRHPAGKRLPFRKRLVFAPNDTVQRLPRSETAPVWRTKARRKCRWTRRPKTLLQLVT